MPPYLGPIRIDQLQPNETVRVQLESGYVLDQANHTSQTFVTAGRIAVARPYRRSSFVGRVVRVDLVGRTLAVETQDLVDQTQYLTVTMRFQEIRVLERQIPGTYVSDNVHRLRIPAYVFVTVR